MVTLASLVLCTRSPDDGGLVRRGRQVKRSEAPAACGAPPAIDDSEPNRYLGYFENEQGEPGTLLSRAPTSPRATLRYGE
jgi:hypothetical protein